MSDVIKIKKGLDIRLEGKADNIFGQAEMPDLFAVKPTDFVGLVPKLAVKVGEQVKAGSVLFYDKYRPEIKFVSPVSGEVTLVNRGERRRILEVIVKWDKTDDSVKYAPVDAKSLSKDEVVSKLLESGLWPFVKQRPYNVIANPTVTPKAIYISAFDSAPLAPDYDFVLSGQEGLFQKGVDVLSQIASVNIGVFADAASKPFVNVKGAKVTKFVGPHPAGNVGVQIHHTQPINKGDVLWTLNPQDVLAIGKLFSEGVYDANRIVVVAGSEVKKAGYFRTKLGANIASLVDHNVESGNLRYISGNVLTGTQIEKNGFFSYYDAQLTVIPEGDEYEFLGWALPGIGKYSTSRSFFSWMCSKKKYALNANLHGGYRAIVVSGQYDKVLPMDILPEHLIKAILIEDIDKMEQLGIYEISEDDIALCEFVCTSKIELQKILRQGLDLMMKEVG